MERRELLKMIAAATGAAMIGIPGLVYGQAPAPNGKSAFSATDIALLDEVADTILPRTKTPGAKDAGAGPFMALYVTDCYTPENQAILRAGLADLDKRAGGRFVAMAPTARTELLRALDTEARDYLSTAKAAAGGASKGPVKPHYFTMLKQLSIFTFFTSQVGANEALQYVAVPGRYDGDMPYVPGTPAWATD
jgi:hypothetical protein